MHKLTTYFVQFTFGHLHLSGVSALPILLILQNHQRSFPILNK